MKKRIACCRLIPVQVAVLALALLAGCQEPRAYDDGPITAEVQGHEVVLWLICQDELKSRGYDLDQVDRRAGLVTTHPRVGSVWYESWAGDVVGMENQAEANLQKVRRTIHLEIESLDEQTHQLTCIVNVERLAPRPGRVTGNVRAQQIFQETAKGMLALREDEQDQGRWAHLGEDDTLARAVLKAIQERM